MYVVCQKFSLERQERVLKTKFSLAKKGWRKCTYSEDEADTDVILEDEGDIPQEDIEGNIL